MIETPTNTRVRDGIARAHQERGAAMRQAFRWLTFRH